MFIIPNVSKVSKMLVNDSQCLLVKKSLIFNDLQSTLN